MGYVLIMSLFSILSIGCISNVKSYAISSSITEASNAVGSSATVEKIKTIARETDGSLNPEVPVKVLNQIAISIGAHGGNITKSIDKIDRMVKSEYESEHNGPLIQSIRDLFPQRYFPNVLDNIINKIGFDAKGLEDHIDRIIIKDVPIINYYAIALDKCVNASKVHVIPFCENLS